MRSAAWLSANGFAMVLAVSVWAQRSSDESESDASPESTARAKVSLCPRPPHTGEQERGTRRLGSSVHA